MDITVNVIAFNMVENEDICRSLQQWATEPRHNVSFWSTGDEELDLGNPGNRMPQNEEDGGFGVFIRTFVKGINDDDS